MSPAATRCPRSREAPRGRGGDWWRLSSRGLGAAPPPPNTPTACPGAPTPPAPPPPPPPINDPGPWTCPACCSVRSTGPAGPGPPSLPRAASSSSPIALGPSSGSVNSGMTAYTGWECTLEGRVIRNAGSFGTAKGTMRGDVWAMNAAMERSSLSTRRMPAVAMGGGVGPVGRAAGSAATPAVCGADCVWAPSSLGFAGSGSTGGTTVVLGPVPELPPPSEEASASILTEPAPSTHTGLELGGGPSDPPAAPCGLGAGCGGDGDRARPGPAGLSPRASEGSRVDANEAAAVVAVAVVPVRTSLLVSGAATERGPNRLAALASDASSSSVTSNSPVLTPSPRRKIRHRIFS